MPRSSRAFARVLAVASLAVLASGLLPSSISAGTVHTLITVVPTGHAYRQRNLVSDVAGMARLTDPLLVGPWGLASKSNTPFYSVEDGTSVFQLYRGDRPAGKPLVPDATVPRVNVPGGLPTGIVANDTSSFQITSGNPSSTGPASFVLASITGNIIAWKQTTPTVSATTVSSNPGHVYMGIAMAANSGGNRLYAADFANNHVDVFDGSFNATTVSGGFTDATIPAGYNPYNVQAITRLVAVGFPPILVPVTSIYVTYAKVGVGGNIEDGAGKGYVRKFNTDGVRDLTFAIDNGNLNAPWGVALAPSTFGTFGGALLVGNSGVGGASINAYDPATGAAVGASNSLVNDAGRPIQLEDLHGLAFGNNADAGDANTLYFNAGLADNEHGLFGSLQPSSSSATSTIQFSAPELGVSEVAKTVNVTISRYGSVASAATVRYATWDESQAGHASQKSDYETNAGYLKFAPGETSKTVTIHLVNDRFVEGDESIGLALSNPTGTGVALGSPSLAQVTIVDDDVTPPTTNPIDGTAFFVRQLYLDILTREPDAAGLTNWSNYINACGTNTTCLKSRRAYVARSLFLSGESLNMTALIYRMHRAAFGRDPLYGDVELGAQVRRTLGVGTVASLIMVDPRFVATYTELSNANYVATLASRSGYAFSTAKKNAWIAALNNHTLSRLQVFQQLAGDSGYAASTTFRNRWIVFNSFWSFDRRDADTFTFHQRLDALNAAGGNAAAVVTPVISSPEYRQRFGPS